MFRFDRFEALREEKGVTKKHIADTLGRTQTIAQDWKKGKSKPNPEQLQIVANILGTTPEYLMGETDEKTPAPIDEGRALSKEERDLIEAFRLLPEEYQEGILAQIEAVLTRKGFEPAHPLKMP